MKNKKAFNSLISIVLLITITIFAYVYFNPWYEELYRDKQFESLENKPFNEEFIKIISFKNESNYYYLYIRNFASSNYSIVDILLNENICLTPSQKYLNPQSISKIQINCSSYTNINAITVTSNLGLIFQKVKLE